MPRKTGDPHTPNDPKVVCRGDLAVKLFSIMKTGEEDLRRWAKTTGDREVIAAVETLIDAAKVAHQKVVPANERRKPRKARQK